MSPSVALLLVDPQNDFCDLPADWCPSVATYAQSPALPVPGAHQDMLRLAAFIDAAGARIDAITVTLDSHQRRDIAHPAFWRLRGGGPVAPFTPITAAQVRSGEFQPRRDQDLVRALAYLDELEARGRYTLMVWPVHCEIGSWGHNVHAAVRAAYNRWEDSRGATVRKVSKGENPWTEHYSAVMAEVPDPADPGTQLNVDLIAELDRHEVIVVAGEASSHCVRATVEHVADHLPSGAVGKLVLLEDCMSPVAGFEVQARDFLSAMSARGVRLVRSAELARHLNHDAVR